eukprot:scaffold47238_cov72-Phaeocystis_antarctica.AAC.5
MSEECAMSCEEPLRADDGSGDESSPRWTSADVTPPQEPPPAADAKVVAVMAPPSLSDARRACARSRIWVCSRPACWKS